MFIAEDDFNHAKRHFPLILPMRNSLGRIEGVGIMLDGIVGGGSRTPCSYTAVITFEGYPAQTPRVWITDPKDYSIRHLNIFPTKSTGILPLVCVGDYDKITWPSLPAKQRTLTTFLYAVMHVLKQENPRSPAR